MEKYKNYIIIAIIAMIIPIIYKMMVTHHEITYRVGKYQIKETFHIKEKEHIYQYQLKNKKEKYTFTIVNNAHKRKKVIKEIKEYKEKDVKCIVPIYKNKQQTEIYCRKNNLQVSKYSLKDDEDYKKIFEKVKKYKIKEYTTSNTTREYKKIKIYQKNIPLEDTVIIWNYKGIIGIQQEEQFDQQMIKYDLYDNIMATCTSRYFVLFENTSVNGIEKIHYYDLKKHKYKVMTLKEKISKNSYINGVENDLIYITDRKAKKQYTINIKKETCKEVGNELNQFIKYENGKGRYMELKDFFEKDQFFHNEKISDQKITESNDMILENDYYYFKEENNFYRKLKEGNKEFLFTEPDIETWWIYQNDLVLKREDCLYLYNDQIGLQKIIEYNELKYNDNAIYYLWK